MMNILESRNSITLRYAANLFILVLFLLVIKTSDAAPATDQQLSEDTEESSEQDPDAYQLYLAQSAVRYFSKKNKDLQNYTVFFQWKEDILLVSFSRKITSDGEFIYFGWSCPFHHLEYSINKKGKIVDTFCPR